MTKKKHVDNEDDIDNDADEKFESNRQREVDKAKIRAENKHNEAVAKETAEDKEIASFKGFPVAGETREQLLERVRKLRDEKPPEAEAPLYRSEGLQKEFEAEQAAGRAAVAKHAEQAERLREAAAKAEGEKNPTG